MNDLFDLGLGVSKSGLTDEPVRYPIVDYTLTKPQGGCSFNHRIDMMMRVCPYGCKYCYIRTGPGGGGGVIRKPITTLSSYTSISAVIDDAAVKTGLVYLGVCNEPSLTPINRLEWLFDYCWRKGVYLNIGTKNPGFFKRFITKETSRLIGFMPSFCSWESKMTDILEPKAPPLEKRFYDLLELLDLGCDVILRFHPFFIGYYDGMESVLDRFKGKVEKVLVDPVRIHKPGWKYFDESSPALYKDEYSLEKYLHKWGVLLPNGKLSMFEALHWFDYDAIKLHAEYKKIRKICHDYKMTFAVGGMMFGWKSIYLSDPTGNCCMTSHKERAGVHGDPNSLMALCMSRQLSRYQFPFLQGKSDTEQEVEFARLEFANNVGYQPFPPEDSIDYRLKDGFIHQQ